jgi:hypothetical protein
MNIIQKIVQAFKEKRNQGEAAEVQRIFYEKTFLFVRCAYLLQQQVVFAILLSNDGI